MSQGLLITAIGMGLVFVMILVLWGIMALLTALTGKAAEREAAEAAEEAAAEEAVYQAAPAEAESELTAAQAVGAAAAAMAAAQDGQKAAALGVAVALARAKGRNWRLQFLSSKPADTGSSPWLSAGRVKQIYRTGR